MSRYAWMLLIVPALAVSSTPAESYPAKPVRILVPTAPGGGYDFIGRLLAEKFSQDFGQAFIVENRTGAGTLVGTQAAAAAPADGHALLIGGVPNMGFH